ncbi:uncharacterized protein EI90DRAFT_3117254 [Cantharellus anzutake]|uniref:uncharacterized protein n=1 Tax=Cantharellus anzutake TaxID=1750568 RepID=UPI0019080941|nr:uncharacterized protein EI90DRAFT_3117254 [Cantharellus anzutake]KAF8340718.1 hypothetical protein EI90DRAFT_3117254 [Cantharellus anzutake]
MSASPSSTAFRSRGFQAPSSSTPVQPPTVSDLPINTDVHGEADDSEVAGDTNNNGTDSDDPTPGDASTVKSIETSITKYAALYAIFHSPFLSKASLLVELSSDFHSWAPTEMFSSVENFNQFCVHKILTMKYPILTNELHTHSGAMPWSAKFVSAVGARRRQMMSRLRQSSFQLFGMDLSIPVLKLGHGPTVEQLQEYLGVIPDSTNPFNHLPLFLFPDNDRSHHQHVFCSQVLAAGIIVIIFGPSALNGPVSSIPFPGSPELENWEPAKLYASQRALGSMYEVTEITPGTLAIVSMLVYFILSGDTEMVSGSGKPSATNYVDILLNFYHFILTLLHREKTTTVQPMHKTMDWYKHLLFGPPAGAGDAHASGRAGSLSLGLSALLEEMEHSGSNEADPVSLNVNVSSEMPQGPEPDVQTEVVATPVSLDEGRETRYGRRGRAHTGDTSGNDSSREVSRGRRGQRGGAQGSSSRRGRGSHGGNSTTHGDE